MSSTVDRRPRDRRVLPPTVPSRWCPEGAFGVWVLPTAPSATPNRDSVRAFPIRRPAEKCVRVSASRSRGACRTAPAPGSGPPLFGRCAAAHVAGTVRRTEHIQRRSRMNCNMPGRTCRRSENSSVGFFRISSIHLLDTEVQGIPRMLGELRISRSQPRTPSRYANLRPVGEVRIDVSERIPAKTKVHELRDTRTSPEFAINPKYYSTVGQY